MYDEEIPHDLKSDHLRKMLAHGTARFGQKSKTEAFVLHKIGVSYYYMGFDGVSGSFDSAIIYFRKALDVRIAIELRTAFDFTSDIINGYFLIAVCHELKGNAISSVGSLSSALYLLDSYPQKDSIFSRMLRLYVQAGRTYSDIGDYDQALKYYQNIIDYPTQNRNDRDVVLINRSKRMAYSESANIFAMHLYQPEKAIGFLTKADSLLEKLNPRNKVLARADIWNRKGIAFFRLDEFDSAIWSFNKSIDIYEDVNRKYELAGLYLNLSLAYKKKGQFQDSEKLLSVSKQLFLDTNQEYKLASIYDNLGDIEFERGKYEQSLTYDNLALQYLIADFSPTSVYDNPNLDSVIVSDKVGLLVTISSKVMSYLQLNSIKKEEYYLVAAFQTMALVDELIMSLRTDFQAEASRISLASFTKPVYEHGLETCYRLYHEKQQYHFLEKAFSFSEKSRAIVLLDAVRKTRASDQVESELILKERQMNLKVNYFEKLAALQEQDLKKKQSFNVYDSLNQYRRQRDEVIRQIKLESPDYHRIIFEEATTSIEEIKNALEEDQSFVEFFVGDSSVYTFVINRDTTLFLKMDQPDSIRKWSNEWIAEMKMQGMDIVEPAHKLYKALIEPVADQLGEKLILVPDDVLNLVNFDALVTKKPAISNIHWPDFKNFMIYDHQMSYAFSASTLMENQQNKDKKSTSFMGVAPKIDEGFELSGQWFNKLDQNVGQIKEASYHFSDRKIVNQEEARATFLEFAPDYDVIHCAAHALANNKDGDLSFILFGEDESEILYAKDLYAQELNANMVVLSACQTSEGEINRGEGVISLARSFTYAGASSVVTSLWSVRENVNHQIIKDFYRLLKSGKSKDEALRQAKIDYRDNISQNNAPNSHPYFWAPLIVIGDTENNFPNRQNALIVIIAALAMFMLILLYLRRGNSY